MPNKHLFEYAVIRVVPRVEREEFLNAGVVLYCASQKFLQVRYCINDSLLHSICADVDTEFIKILLTSFEQICNGEKCASPIASLPNAERFRWLTATRSTVIQCSAVHPGLCDNAAITLDKIFLQQVNCANPIL